MIDNVINLVFIFQMYTWDLMKFCVCHLMIYGMSLVSKWFLEINLKLFFMTSRDVILELDVLPNIITIC